MGDVFIEHIYINEVRHLKDVRIAIDETERKHLVITGKNGSGKTSLLLKIKDNLSSESKMTHSPFVISSLENCVIYDLEKQLRIEDATGYSYDTIIESYFGSDKYSHKVTEKVEEFEKLALKSSLLDKEKVNLLKLESYFEKVPRDLAPELNVKLQQIKLKQLNRKTG